MNTSKKWCLSFLGLVLAVLVLFSMFTGYIDPYFHYHAPAQGLKYPLNNQRYQNDGIVKHFDYDAIITGTSMTENFLTSEFDALYGTHAIKVNYSGGTFDEIFSTVELALESSPDLKVVLLGIDIVLGDVEMIESSGDYPVYLYDSNPFNDVNYLLNREILYQATLPVLHRTLVGQATTTFDEYANWHSSVVYGKDLVLQNYQRLEKPDPVNAFSLEEQAKWEAGLRNSIVRMAQENPDVQFLCFYPPYSIVEWDKQVRLGKLQHRIDALQLTTRVLLEEENIQVYSFYNDYETVTNLDNYKDTVHHSQDINSLMLQRIHNGEYRLTADNYQSHWDEVLDFYQNYDYDRLFS